MNVGRRPSDPPDRKGEEHGSIGERPESGPQNWAGLISQAIANWPTTWRLVVLIVVIFVTGFGALWLVPMDLSFGWIEISQR
ncbi:hypothetical protein [Nocardia sp. NRRL S-836]|uniref:hypothetical protein n=1 Tax=Nocardia sp. NRRL S-836 TaxID=1519492 RepID=UPI000B23FAF8|nr:hypothetical protein [Nocardia sp. NRRL S-836]